MTRKIPCPYGGWIELPDKWLGRHARRKDEAEAKARDAGLPSTFIDFSVAMALLENWGDMPEIGANPETWRLDDLELGLMSWIINTVIIDYALSLQVPKNFSLPSPAL